MRTSVYRFAGVSLAAVLVLTAWGQPAVGADAQVSLVALNRTVRADPGAFVTLTFQLRNEGDAAVEVQLTADMPPGLSLLGGLPAVMLAGASIESLFVTVIVSRETEAGPAIVALTARIAGGMARAEATVDVERVAGLSLRPPPDGSAEPGQSITLEFGVTNDGNGPDRVALDVDAPAAVQVAPTSASLTLLAGETRRLAVTLTVPAETDLPRVRVTLVASSTSFPTVSARATTTLDVLPPLPEAVGGRLVLEVPSTFALGPTVLPNRDVPLVLTASVAGAADFDDGDRIDYRLALDNLAVRDLRFELRRGAVETRLGRLAVTWTELIDQAGDGAQLTLEGLPLQGAVSLAALLDGLWPRVGTQLGADVVGMRLQLSQLARFDPEGRVWLGSLSLTQSVGEAIRLGSEWALSQADTGERVWGNVIRFDWEGDDFRVDGEWIRTDAAFLGDRPGRRGFRLAQALEHDDVAVQLAYSRVLDQGNVSGTGALLETAWRSSLRWTPSSPWPSWVARLDFDGAHAPPNLGQSSRLLASLGMRQEIAPLSLGATASRLSSVDATGAHDDLTLRAEAAVDLAPARLLLRAGQTLAVSPLHVAPSPAGTELLAALQLTGALGRGALSLLLLGDVVTVDAVLDLQTGPLRAAAELELELDAAGLLSAEARAELSVAFNAPVAFIPVGGRVTGVAFEDANQNGLRDSDEAGIADLVFRVGDARVRTDAEGRYRTPPLSPGAYEIRLNALPLELVAGPVPGTVTVSAGETKRADLPLNRVGVVRGVVFDDRDQDGIRDADEAGLENAVVDLRGAGRTAPGRTDDQGRFSFSGLAPGSYRLTLDVSALPPRSELTTPDTIAFTLSPGQTVEAAFGAYQRPRAIRFVPTATFTVSPELPQAGEPVTFNGSNSFDPDGRVVGHAWDLDGDGQADAEGATVTRTYDLPGTVRVTLTVRDDQGNTDSLSQDVVIAAP